ncbi:MAG: succinylglutamate desuccinylase/aspartoacylase family protein [Clostridiales bacterium]|nr:succinylglutamate desuccinylase/aspartoacylase family protein [Clostridiales bacterium]
MKKHQITALVCLVAAAAIAIYSGNLFLSLRKPDKIIPGPGVTEVRKLSDYFSELKGTRGDSDIYILKGAEEGGKVLVLGGTHPNEPSGYLSAVIMVEKGKVSTGEVYVIPRANNSAFTHNDSQEASPLYLHFDNTKGEERAFRFGSRATNPIDQWPDPDVYEHAASGQQLSGSETRNLNRGYPGRPKGNLTEQMCYAITELIKKEDIGLTFDLHEASPEYPVINATVAHEKSMDIAAFGMFELDMIGIKMQLEPSPVNLHGLTHRELGDYTDTYPLLMETANASQGRLRGATNEELALTGKDKFYVSAQKLGMLYVPYDENGHPIEERVGRHLQSIQSYVSSYNDFTGETVVLENLPSYDEMLAGRLGDYLN